MRVTMSNVIHAVDYESSSGKSMSDLMVSQGMFMKSVADEDDAFGFSRDPGHHVTEF